MKELLNEVEQAAKNELARANKKNPLFNSPHEAYAVIKEEAEEAEYECARTRDAISQFWSYVKCDGGATDILDYLNQTKESAINLAAEATQVAAMAQKAMDSLGQFKG